VMYIQPMSKPSQLLFLPGALGRTEFWRPVSDLLADYTSKVHLTWPGFSGIPRDPSIRGIDDLVTRVVDEIHEPTALIAQSMGGVIAILAALRKPEYITHLVLSVTSGGLGKMTEDAEDWRPAARAIDANLPDWFTSYHDDLTNKLPSLTTPTLLIWGDADPISPVRVGERLAAILPHAELHVIAGGDHGVANTFAGVVAPLIDRHLSTT
jgi:pimeloyl-ACP methyl ester carboxylesterase